MSVKYSQTLAEYITEFKNQSFRMSEIFLKELLKDNKVKEFYNEESLVNQHGKFIDAIKVKYTMSNEEFRKYMCNPWYMAHDVYGNTELWFMILHANEMYSATEFTKKTIYLYSSNLLEYLREIKTARSDILNENQNEIYLSKRAIIEGTDGMWD